MWKKIHISTSSFFSSHSSFLVTCSYTINTMVVCYLGLLTKKGHLYEKQFWTAASFVHLNFCSWIQIKFVLFIYLLKQFYTTSNLVGSFKSYTFYINIDIFINQSKNEEFLILVVTLNKSQKQTAYFSLLVETQRALVS